METTDKQTLTEVINWAYESFTEQTKFWLLGLRDARAMSAIRVGVRHSIARGWTKPIIHPFVSEFREAIRAEFGPHAEQFYEDILDGVVDRLLGEMNATSGPNKRNSDDAEPGDAGQSGCSVSGEENLGKTPPGDSGATA